MSQKTDIRFYLIRSGTFGGRQRVDSFLDAIDYMKKNYPSETYRVVRETRDTFLFPSENKP